MSTRQRLRREKLEIYLVHLLLAYRRYLLIVGLFLLLYSIATMFSSPLVGFASLAPAFYLLLLSNSYPVVLYTARLGAWIGTLRSQE